MEKNDKQLARMFVDSAYEAKKDELPKLTNAFVDWLKENGEVHRLRRLIALIDNVWKDKFGVSNILIETAYPLSDKQKKQMESISHGAQITEKINPEIIGGARIVIDETVVDGSIAKKLQTLGKHLLCQQK